MENTEAIFQTTKETPSGDRTVMVADDDPIFRRLLQKRLQDWGYKVIAVDNGEKAWEALQQPGTPPSLLPPGLAHAGNRRGPKSAGVFEASNNLPTEYSLLISGKDDKQDVVEGLDAGALDHLTKPFDSGELRARLRAGSRALSLHTVPPQAHEELRYQATHDALTGVWSRGAVLDLLRCELRRGQREDTPSRAS